MTASDRDTEVEADAAPEGQRRTSVEARQAVKTRHLRWVLAISLTLGVVALGGAYAWYTSLYGPATATTAAVDRPTSG